MTKLTACKLEVRYVCSSHNSFDRQQECKFFEKCITKEKCDHLLVNNICASFPAIAEIREQFMK